MYLLNTPLVSPQPGRKHCRVQPVPIVFRHALPYSRFLKFRLVDMISHPALPCRAWRVKVWGRLEAELGIGRLVAGEECRNEGKEDKED